MVRLLMSRRVLHAQEHLTQHDVDKLDMQRAAWLAARMLREAADARKSEDPRATFPSESLLSGVVRRVALHVQCSECSGVRLSML